MKKLIFLALAILPLTGCNAFRSDISTVSAYGGYSDASGDQFKAGVQVGIRAPTVDHSK